MAQYDLTPALAEYLDGHLVLPLLEFVESRAIFPVEEVLQEKLKVLSHTKLVDFAIECHNKLFNTDTAPTDFMERRESAVAELHTRRQEMERIQKILDEPDILDQLRQDKTESLECLKRKYGFQVEDLDTLYSYAKFEFDTGKYGDAAAHLTFFVILSTDVKKLASAMWGKTSSEILMQNWEAALEDIGELRDGIDSKNMTQVEQLNARTWLLHWSLFVFFNHDQGREAMIDMCFHPAYMNAIQTSCPHILRYLATAIITTRKQHRRLKDLVRVIRTEKYRDPIIELLECLYVKFDFDEAQTKLRECDAVLENDYFLSSLRDQFMQNARLFIFETYCRVHQCIRLDMLAEKLNLSVDDAERWIVDLIRNARLDAKIDSATGTVVMGTPVKSIYQKVIEQTKDLSIRSQMLASTVEKRLVQQQQRQTTAK